MHKVSVIVPVYNVEKYVDICIKSIIHQTYKDLEIILVDDGSKDKSGDICDRFAKKDSRIKVIHQTNSGVSRARNNGLACATGEYVCFVDSDDWLPKDSVEILCKAMEDKNVDFVNANVEYVYAIKNGKKEYNNSFVNVNDKDAFSDYFINMSSWGPCSKLYNRAIIYENEIFFPEDIKSGEDTLFLSYYFKKCHYVGSISEVAYYYNRTRELSATKQYFPNYNQWMFRIIDSFSELFPNEDKESINQAMSVISIWHINKSVDNYIRFSSVNETESSVRVNEAYEYVKKYLPDHGISTFCNERRCTPNVIKIVETLINKGVGEEFYNLVTSNEKFEKTHLQQVKQLIKKIISRIKIEYYRLTV